MPPITIDGRPLEVGYLAALNSVEVVPTALLALPDETIASLATRYHFFSCHSDSRTTLAELFGSAGFVPHSSLPSRLAYFSKVTAGRSDSEAVKKLAVERTLFPYLTFGATVARRTAVLEAMEGPFFPKATAGMLSGLLGGEDHLKWCQLCAKDDDIRYGTPYWHRAHQLHQVQVCHSHGTPLIHASSSASLRDRHRLFLPKIYKLRSPIFLADETQVRQWRFAKLSADLLCVDFKEVEKVDLRSVYISKARAKGFSSGNHSIDYQALTLALDEHHARYDFLQSPKVFCRSVPVAQHWVMPLFRSKRSLVHPVAHILLIDFLFGSVSELFQAPPSSPSRPKSADKIPDLDTLLHRYVNEQAKTLTEIATLTSVSVTTLKILMRRHGIPVKSKPKLITLDVERQVLNALEDGRTVSEAAEGLNLTMISVYRVLRSHPDVQARLADKKLAEERRMRRARLSAAIANSDLPVKKIIPADYTWLWRNDHEWLSCTLGSRPRPRTHNFIVNWAERDSKLSSEASLAAEEICKAQGKPVRITKNEIYRRVPTLRVLDKKLALLPQTALVLDSSVESKSAFYMRRLTWALNEMQNAGHNISASGIVRFACIRETAIPMAEVLIADLAQMSRHAPAQRKRA